MKLTNVILVIALSAATAFAVTHYVSPTTQSTQAKETAYQRVMRTGTLRCGYVLYPGFIERDPNTNQMSGRYYTLVEELGHRLGLKIDWAEETGAANGLEGLNARRFDVMCTPFNHTPSRARVAEFSLPAFYTPTFAYVRADDVRFDHNLISINDPSVKISILEGEVAQTIAAEDFPKATTVTLPNLSDISQVYLNVMLGKADVVLTEPSAIDAFLINNPGKLKRVEAPPVRMQCGGVSVAVGEDALKSLLDTTIETLISTGYVERLFIKSEKDKDFYFLPAQPWRRAGE